MKGSAMFWLALFIAAILFGEYQLFIHIDTWTWGEKGVSSFKVVNITVLVLWEFIFAICRAGGEYSDDDYYNFQKQGFSWEAFSPLFLLYILIRYYINPFLDKLLK